MSIENQEQLNQQPADYDKVLADFKKSGTYNDELVRLELVEMAEGGNPRGGDDNPDFKGIREEYYQGWRNEDFENLLADLGYPIQKK